MRFIYVMLMTLSLNAFAAYDNTWNVSHFWSGEYPRGFSVTVPHTLVMGRLKANLDLARNVRCEMPYLATIHPWNEARTRANKITFISFTKIVDMTVKEDFVFTSERKHVPLKKGDKIQYIQNYGEGAFAIRIKGADYDADQSLFEHLEEVDYAQFAEDDWLLMTCANGKRAYIFFNDLLQDGQTYAPGISGMGPGLEQYGRARDITEEEALELEKNRYN